MSTVCFLADHDLNEHFVEGLRRREPGIQIVRARDVGLQALPDSEILEYAGREYLVLISHDVNTMTATASQRRDTSLGLPGLLMVPQAVSVGVAINSLLLIWSATELEDWVNQIVFLLI